MLRLIGRGSALWILAAWSAALAAQTPGRLTFTYGTALTMAEAVRASPSALDDSAAVLGRRLGHAVILRRRRPG